MRRLIFSVIIALILFTSFLRPVQAQDTQYANCDQCGLCQRDGVVQPTPQSWEKCRECLYPNTSSSDPLYTLVVDPTTNAVPTTQPGHLYTMIGCVQSTFGFTDDGAATSVVNLILGYIFKFAGGIAFLYLIYGAYIILTSQSDPEKLNYGKRVVGAAIVGLVFCLFSVFIVNLLATGILKLPGFSGDTPTPTP